MAKHFAELTFTDSVKEAQRTYGSREMYEKFENRMPDQNRIYDREIAHLAKMDGFYISTVNENGWPYVQFRGGPKGFLKPIDQQTLGYADFKGNMQYISTGNINVNKKAALILMHYPTRTRLKVMAETEILDPKDNPKLLEKLTMPDYKANIERLVLFHIEAFDWNCPQHITPRFSMEELNEMKESHPELLEDLLN